MPFSFRTWLETLRSEFLGSRRHKRRSRRLHLETLEDRVGPAVLTVSSLADNVTADTRLTLREAILLVNHQGNAHAALDRVLTAGELRQISVKQPFGENDTIQFAAYLFPSVTHPEETIALSKTGDQTAGRSAFGITTKVTINGPANLNDTLILTNAAGVNQRLFYVAATGNLTLQNLVLRGGVAQGGSSRLGGGAAGMGGAIFNEGALQVVNCELSGNTASGGAGRKEGLGKGGGGLGGDSTPAPDNKPLGVPGGPNAATNVAADGGFGGGGREGYFDGKKTGSVPGGNGGFGAGGGAGGGTGGFGGGGGDTISTSGKKYVDAASLPEGPGGFGGGEGGGGGAGMGGAIFNAAGSVTITNSDFFGNAALGGAGWVAGSAYGGALFNLNGKIVLLQDSMISNDVEVGSSLDDEKAGALGGGAVFTMGRDGVYRAGHSGATVGTAAGAQATITRTALATSQPGVNAFENYSGTTSVVDDNSAPTITSISPAGTITPGVTETIIGDNFTFATAVNFGTIPATSFHVMSQFQITATAPPGTTGGDITVVNAHGTSAPVSADQFAEVSNDALATAYPLTGITATTTGVNVGYTGEAGEPDPTGNSAPLTSAWWQWTAPSRGPVTIDTFGSNFNTTLGVYVGTAVNNLTPVAVNDDSSPGVQSQVTFNAVAGITYEIAVNGVGGATGDITLNLAMAPEIDQFSPNVGTLSGGTTVTITGMNFSPESNVYFGGNPSPEVVFISSTEFAAVTPPASAPGSADVVVTGDDGTSTLAAEPYLYSNDNFFDAATLKEIVTSGTISGTGSGNNVGYTEEFDEPNPAGDSAPQASAWWKFTAPADGTVTISTLDTTTAADFNTTLGVYTGSSLASLSLVGANDQTVGTVNGLPVHSQVTFQAKGGTTYYIDVGGIQGATGDIILDLTGTTKTSVAVTSKQTTSGGPVTLTATLSASDVQGTVFDATGVSLGMVQFKDRGVNLGAPRPVTLVNGVFSATFTTTLPKTGTQFITADFIGAPDATSSVSKTLDVAGVPAKLQIVSHPLTARHDKLLPAFKVRVLDASGDPVLAGTIVHVRLATGHLLGLLTEKTDRNGYAIFKNLKIAKAGHYTLEASVSGLKKIATLKVTVI